MSSTSFFDALTSTLPQNRRRVFFTGYRNDYMHTDLEDPEAVPRLYMGAFAGLIQHPDWFTKKYSHLFQAQLL